MLINNNVIGEWILKIVGDKFSFDQLVISVLT